MWWHTTHVHTFSTFYVFSVSYIFFVHTLVVYTYNSVARLFMFRTDTVRLQMCNMDIPLVRLYIWYHFYLDMSYIYYLDCTTIVYITASFILPLTRSLSDDPGFACPGWRSQISSCQTSDWIHMYQASHVIYTIITISTTWYFNQSLSVSHTTGSSYWSPHSSRTHPDMAYGYHYPNERVTK